MLCLDESQEERARAAAAAQEAAASHEAAQRESMQVRSHQNEPTIYEPLNLPWNVFVCYR